MPTQVQPMAQNRTHIATPSPATVFTRTVRGVRPFSSNSSNATKPKHAIVLSKANKGLHESKLKLVGPNTDLEPSSLPQGYHWYETLMIMRCDLQDKESDEELAKFENFLKREQCLYIDSLSKPQSTLAYPIQKNLEGRYILCQYAAKRQVARKVQLLLSKPEAGVEAKIVRHITFCKR